MRLGKNEGRKSNTLKKGKKEKTSFDFSKYTDFSKIKTFFSDSKNQYLIGVSLLFVGVFLCFSFASYFFTWQADQDKIEIWSNSGLEAFANENVVAKNNAGTLGAKISHFFIHDLFGITSFFIPFLLILGGIELSFKKSIGSFKKITAISITYALVGSAVLSLVFANATLNPGGVFGYQITNWLGHILGVSGTIIFLLVSVLVSLLVFFEIRMDVVLQKLTSASTSEESEDEGNGIQAEDNIISSKETILSSKTIYPPTPFKEKSVSIEGGSNRIEEENNIVETLNQETIIPLETENTTVTDENLNTETNTVSFDLENQSPLSSVSKNEETKLEFVVEEGVKEETSNTVLPAGTENYDPTLDLSSYKFPTIDLLKDYEVNNEGKVSQETLEANKNNIVNTLNNYKISIKSIKASVGPTVTLYEIVPADGVRISKIKNLEDDIALSLAALGIRIIAPIPGRGTIGIEVPNPNPEVVAMRTVIASKAFTESEHDLPIALGKTISNETYVTDLAKMPHLLMAGATGQGKSVGLNCILVSLLYKKHPSQLKFVLVDPKKVELTLFNKIERHFLAKLPGDGDAIITETSKVVNTLNSLCVEMDQRYELLKEAHCRNLKEYNVKFIARKLNPEKGHRYLPFIVLVVDEFADLIMTAGKEVETPIARLAQLARAIGIHLIIATQRPSVNIITGTIKANFPARIAFRVTSKIDSRTILDAGGADQLIGRGDMLLSTGNDLIRLQCAFVDTPEVEEITDFIGNQRGYPDALLLPEVADSNDGTDKEDIHVNDRDALFMDAARVIVMHQQGSASLLQRKLKLGYNRAGRIVDQLEAAGVIGQFEGSKPRQVLVPDEHSLEQLLNQD